MIPKNSKIWKLLSEACETPGEFLSLAIKLRGESLSSFARILDTSESYVIMMCNDKNIPAEKACYRIAKALCIDPYLLNRVCSDYKMRLTIEKMEKK